MVILDLLDDRNLFNTYADGCTAEAGWTAGRIMDLYDLRDDPSFGTDGFRGNGMENRYSADFMETLALVPSMDGGPSARGTVASYFHRNLCGFAALHEWNRYRRVYSVDPDFYRDLAATERIDLDFGSFGRLPFSSFYVRLPEGTVPHTRHYMDVDGVIVTSVSDSALHLTIVDSRNPYYNPVLSCRSLGRWHSGSVDSPGGRLYSGDCRIVDLMLYQNAAGRNASKGTMDTDLGWNVPFGDVTSVLDVKSPAAHEIIMFILHFIYFLHSKSDDIVENPVSASGRGKKHCPGNGPISRWEVGVRYGEKIRASGRTGGRTVHGGAQVRESARRDRPRPYVRRAHWHKYWCGTAGGRRLELRWIEPVFCNGGNRDITATVNIVTDSEAAGSSGEEAVRHCLESMGIPFEREYTVNIGSHNRRYDFAVHHGSRILFIEFDGIQHFRPVAAFGGDDAFKERRRADWDKDRYARKNGIPLLRIRHDQTGRIPEIIHGFLERPCTRRFNPEYTNKDYYVL